MSDEVLLTETIQCGTSNLPPPLTPTHPLPLLPPPLYPVLLCLFTGFFLSGFIYIFLCQIFVPFLLPTLASPPPFHPLFHGFVTGEEGETGRRRKDSDFVSFFSLLFSFFFLLDFVGFCWAFPLAAVLVNSSDAGRRRCGHSRWDEPKTRKDVVNLIELNYLRRHGGKRWQREEGISRKKERGGVGEC